MTWERFGYICRKANVDCKDQEAMSECLSRIGSESACNLYGSRIIAGSWPGVILDKIGRIQDKSEAQDAINIYKHLNLSRHFEEPMRFKRVIAYLSYVSIIFYFVVGIYQFFVAPSFLDAFENLEISTPTHLMFYQDYWEYLVLVVSIFLITALLTGFQIRKLFKFETGVENSLIIKYLVFQNIRRSYLRVIDILQFPIHHSIQPESSVASPITDHLQLIKNSKMSLAVEMQELIEIEMRRLLESCEKQMKALYTVVAIIVIAAVFFFLVSAYSPIFILGETV
jgi:hypothetical protein